MPILNNQLSTPHAGAVLGNRLLDLAEILAPDVNLATWSRASDPRIARLLARGEFRVGPGSRTTARSSDPRLAQQIRDLIPAAAVAADPLGAATLADDIHFVTMAFAELVAADELMVSLEQPDGASCPRFHVDKIGIRMLVTYQGPGTEWLPETGVDRRWLGTAGMGIPDEQSGVIRKGAKVRRLPTFAVALLKGEAWPNARGFGAVHRSPDPKGRPRTLLRVDMLTQEPLSPPVESTA